MFEGASFPCTLSTFVRKVNTDLLHYVLGENLGSANVGALEIKHLMSFLTYWEELLDLVAVRVFMEDPSSSASVPLLAGPRSQQVFPGVVVVGVG